MTKPARFTLMPPTPGPVRRAAPASPANDLPSTRIHYPGEPGVSRRATSACERRPRRLAASLVGTVLLSLTLVVSARAAGSAPPALGQLREACKADVGSWCPGVRAGEGRLLRCLEAHEASLSAGCRTALASAAACRDEIRAACGEDGARERRRCVREKAGQPGSACRAGGDGDGAN